MSGFISGFFLIGCLPFLPDLSIWVWGLPAVFIFLYPLDNPFRSIVFKVVIGFYLSSLIASIYGHSTLNSRLPELLSGQTFVVTGVVTGLPVNTFEFSRFDLQVEDIITQSDDEAIKASVIKPSTRQNLQVKKVRISWYRPTGEIKPGDRFQASVKLKTPHSFWNPFGKDYERWALTRNIDATGYIKRMVSLSPAKSAATGLRYRMISWVENRFSKDISGSVKALWFGDKSQISDNQWQLLRDTGTTHLMVVSGLHIGVLLFIGWWVGRLFNMLLLVKPGVVHNPLIFPVIFALCLSGVYVYLAGFSIPTQRAWFMGLVMLGAKLLKYPVSIWRRWWIAMAVVLTLQPLSFYESGFWLSFLAVAVLLCLVSIRDKWGALRTGLRMQGWIFLLMGPVLIYLFGQIKIVSPFVNLLAIPFITVWISISIPAVVIESFGYNWALDGLAQWLIHFWSGLSVFRDAIDWSLTGLAGNELSLLFAMVGSCLILQPWSRSLKWMGLLGWLPLFSPSPETVQSDQFEAIVFDVGQGASVLINTSEASYLYDTGIKYRSGNTAFEKTVLPYLQAKGIRVIDRLIISHDDIDHAGGLEVALNRLRVLRLDSGMPDEISKKASIPVHLCRSGEEWTSGGVSFRYLHPDDGEQENDNNQSCILEVAMDQCRFLLMGDVDQSIEASVAKTLRPSYWLLAGHHGSNTSTGQTLLDAVQPKDVLISAGYLNRYFHPHPSVLRRIQLNGANVYRTDHQGALVLFKDQQGRCRTQPWRQREKPYWSTF